MPDARLFVIITIVGIILLYIVGRPQKKMDQPPEHQPPKTEDDDPPRTPFLLLVLFVLSFLSYVVHTLKNALVGLARLVRRGGVVVLSR